MKTSPSAPPGATEAASDAATDAATPVAPEQRHAAAWESLARKIADTRDDVTDAPVDPPSPGTQTGHLTVLGSGIDSMGFQIGDEAVLRDADDVFYCVADPATMMWLKEIRPDAMDLYVLYDDSKPRFVTYMQMAESLLYPVRQGRRVVCVFYGHPGIFVLATHRAIAIAKREGYRATMKANVSALDTLCADLGVDPSHPGMHTYEATDMLVRRRRPDPSLHLVLWQVGLIGEMGFRRQGYVNRNFSTFIRYLQDAYGEAYPVTHYIAARYPTLAPTVETYPLDALHDPAVQVKITGLSTFYLAPRDVTPADEEVVRDLGLLKPGQSVKTPDSPLRIIDRYGPREKQLFDDFASFTVPTGYHWQPDTAAGRFLVALRMDAELQRLYQRDPHAALADPRFADLSASERRLLVTRDPGAVQIAAKGLQRQAASNRALLVHLLRSRSACSDLAAASREGRAREQLEAWAAAHDHTVHGDSLAQDVRALNRHHLLSWTGVYADSTQDRVITVLGHSTTSDKSLLYVDDLRIRFFTFGQGALHWRTMHGNPHNGFLRLDVNRRGERALIGQIWTDGVDVPADCFMTAPEVDPHRAALGPVAGGLRSVNTFDPVAGTYRLRCVGASEAPLLTLQIGAAGATLDGSALSNAAVANGTLTWGTADETPSSRASSDAASSGAASSGAASSGAASSGAASSGAASSGAASSGAVSSGRLMFLVDPLSGGAEVYGRVTLAGGPPQSAYGAQVEFGRNGTASASAADVLPDGVADALASLCAQARDTGGLLLWHKWEKFHFTTRVVNVVLPPLTDPDSC